MFIDFDQKSIIMEIKNFMKILFFHITVYWAWGWGVPVYVKIIIVLSGKIKLQNYIIGRQKKYWKLMHQNSNDNYLWFILLVSH